VGIGLAEVLRHFGQHYRRSHGVSAPQARVWRAIVDCRTAELGGSLQQCDHCQAREWRYHSCRNRHCPRCQQRAQDAWRRARVSELIDVPYAHLVFTLPHALNALAGYHPRWVYDTLFACVAATLTEFSANPRWLGAQSGFTLVLHTWTQDLRTHIHVHALVPCGGLGEDGQWRQPARGEAFLFPVHALSRVFRGKFLDALRHAEQHAQLPRDPQGAPELRHARRQRLLRHDWVVYAKAALRGAASVLDYLSRYTYRIAVSDERIRGIKGNDVVLRVRADDSGGKRCVHIDGVDFIGRFLSHVLPPGYKRIRHYGWLAAGCKRERLAAVRAARALPPPNPIAREQAEDFMRRVAALEIARCPHCRTGRWRIVQTSPPDRSAHAPLAIPKVRAPP
jgi:Putative transposase/Transposase zinc-binding domain